MKVKVDSKTNISKLKVQNKTPQVSKASLEKDVDTDDEEQLLAEQDKAICMTAHKTADDDEDDDSDEVYNSILPQLNVTSASSTTLNSTTSRNNLIVSS